MSGQLPRKPCPTCGRTVAWRTVRAPRANRGRYGTIPPLRIPVAHKRSLDEPAPWCKAGTP